MRWMAVTAAVFLASCATTSGTKCPDKPFCIGSMKCSTDRNGCQICQCDAMVDDRNDNNSDPTRRPGDPR